MPPLALDLPVCFPHRPCVDYSPLEADAINLYLAIGPVGIALLVAGASLLLAGIGIAVVTWAIGGSRRDRA